MAEQKEASLLEQQRSVAADDGDLAGEASRTLRWLTLNYLAVLKIAKKHDKRCSTHLLAPIAKVLMSQPFVRGLTGSAVFGDAAEPRDAANSAAARPAQPTTGTRTVPVSRVESTEVFMAAAAAEADGGGGPPSPAGMAARPRGVRGGRR